MNKHIITIVVLFSFFTSNTTNLKLSDRNVHPSSEVGKVKLFHHNKKGFKLFQDGKMHSIPSHSLSPELRSISNKKLAEYQKHAYFKVNKQSDGEFSISSHVRGQGGGPALGAAVYWGIKSFFYGGAAVGATAAIISGAGAAGITSTALVGAATSGALTVPGAAVAAATIPMAAAPAAVTVVTGAVTAVAASSPTIVAGAALGGTAMITGASGTGVAISGGLGAFGAFAFWVEGIATVAGVACGMAPTP